MAFGGGDATILRVMSDITNQKLVVLSCGDSTLFQHMTIVTRRDVTAPRWKFPVGTVAEIKCIGNFGSLGFSLEGEALGVSETDITVLPFLMVVRDMKSVEDFEIVSF